VTRRLVTGLAAAALGVLAVVAALSFFNARDDSTTTSATGAGGPGTAVPAQAGALGARLRAGNVDLRYGAAADRRPLQQLALAVAGPRSPELAAAGQEVRVVREPGLRGVRAVAWRRELRTPGAASAALRDFVEHWLGRGVHG
jgi:hypothetical protein